VTDEPTMADLRDLAREWINARDAITARAGSSLTILTNDDAFMRTMQGFTQRALTLVGTGEWYLWEGLAELLYMAKNSLPVPKKYQQQG